MTNFVHTIKGINNITKQEKWTNKSGSILVQANKDTYVNADGEYKPITFPIHEAGNNDTTHVADMVVNSDSTKEILQHGDHKQVVTISDKPTVELSEDVKEAWQGALDTVNLHGDQTVYDTKTFDKQIKGKIDDSAHADEADHAKQADSSKDADHAKSADKVAHTLTVKQDGQDDVIYDGSNDEVVEIHAGGTQWGVGHLRGIGDSNVSGIVYQYNVDDGTILMINPTITVEVDATNKSFKFSASDALIGKPLTDVAIKMVLNRGGVKSVIDAIYSGQEIKVIGNVQSGDILVTSFSTINSFA